MKQKLNSVPSAETNDEMSAKDDITMSSPNNAKPDVGCRLSLSTQELFPISKRQDLSVIDYHFTIRQFGNEKVNIPYVPLYDYLRCVEMLQTAEYQIKSLEEALSRQQQKNQ